MGVDADYSKRKKIAKDKRHDHDQSARKGNGTVGTAATKHSGKDSVRGHYGSDDDLQRYTGSFLYDSMSTLL